MLYVHHSTINCVSHEFFILQRCITKSLLLCLILQFSCKKMTKKIIQDALQKCHFRNETNNTASGSRIYPVTRLKRQHETAFPMADCGLIVYTRVSCISYGNQFLGRKIIGELRPAVTFIHYERLTGGLFVRCDTVYAVRNKRPRIHAASRNARTPHSEYILLRWSNSLDLLLSAGQATSVKINVSLECNASARVKYSSGLLFSRE